MVTPWVLGQSPEQFAADLARLRKAMVAAGERCGGCGRALCRECKDIYRMTGQHIDATGTCPHGHREPMASTEEGTE